MSAELHALHKLHQELRDVSDRLTRGPKQISARQQLVEKRKADVAERREQLKRSRMAADQKSLQLKTNEAKIADLRGKLNLASSNREYETISQQIAADEMANSVLEDEILEALDAVDGMQVQVADAEKAVVAAEDDARAFAEQFAQQEDQLRQSQADLQARTTAAESAIPSAIREQYRRLVAAYGADAMAAVENRACTNCYVALTQQHYVQLNTGNPMFCKSCGRLMYLPPSA